jgi:peptidylprolyl isomerase
MRRSAALSAAIGVIALLAACGGDDDGATDTTTPAATAATTAPTATSTPEETVVEGTVVPATTGAAASVPEVELPTESPTELVVTEITPGEGPQAADGDTVFVNYVGVRSEDGTEFDSNYGATPFQVMLGSGGVIAGWEQGLQGAQAGSRLQLDIPADLAYGDNPQGEIIQPGDALSFVIDVQAVVPATDPADAPTEADMPLSDEPVSEIVVEDLTEGDGAELAEGDTAVLHLVAARSDTGEELQSTWAGGAPQPFVIAEGQFLPALVESLPGMKVGGRRAITIPAATFQEDVASPSTVVPEGADVLIIADLFGVL